MFKKVPVTANSPAKSSAKCLWQSCVVPATAYCSGVHAIWKVPKMGCMTLGIDDLGGVRKIIALLASLAAGVHNNLP